MSLDCKNIKKKRIKKIHGGISKISAEITRKFTRVLVLNFKLIIAIGFTIYILQHSSDDVKKTSF